MRAQLQASEVLDSRQLLKVLTDFKKGDFSVRMPTDQVGITGKICDALNDTSSGRLCPAVAEDGPPALSASTVWLEIWCNPPLKWPE